MISIELNEVNEKWIKHYIAENKLPNFKKLFEENKKFNTYSEKKYHELEPWIQWPSFYTGKSFQDHNCFHIGDFRNHKLSSIYTDIQSKGKSVLAISPMNCFFEEENSSVFLPDPWENFETKDKGFLTKLYKAIQDKVNTNATSNSKISSYIILMLGFFKYCRVKNYPKYLKYIFLSIEYKWYQAIVLDLLLFDIFISEHEKGIFSYSSIFLNAGAHIQHHYLFDSECYKGNSINPDGYSRATKTNKDPLLEIYKAYDDIIGEILSKNCKFMVSTGLQQKENEKPYCQYRFNNHDKTLRKLKIDFDEVTARMSRDFTLHFSSLNKLKTNEKLLKSIKVKDQPLFDVDADYNSNTIFIKIAWTKEIEAFKDISLPNEKYDILNEVSLVSVENSIHIAQGWHVRNFEDRSSDSNIKIWSLRKLISENV